MSGVLHGLLAGATGKPKPLIYAATPSGLSISNAEQTSFTNRTTANGLGNSLVNGVHVVGSTVYAATYGGLSISTDGGTTFTNYTTANGLISNRVNCVFSANSIIYAGSISGNIGFCRSTDGGATFVKPTIFHYGANQGANFSGGYVYDIYAIGSRVWFCSNYGLYYSTDSGATFNRYEGEYGWGNMVNKDIRGIHVLSEGTSTSIFAACFDSVSGLFVSHDNGGYFYRRGPNESAFSGSPPGGLTYLTSVHASGPPGWDSTVVVGSQYNNATSGGIARSINGGYGFTSKKPVPAGGGNADWIRCVWQADGKIYAGTNYYYMTVSQDNGATYTGLTSGLGYSDVYDLYVG